MSYLGLVAVPAASLTDTTPAFRRGQCAVDGAISDSARADYHQAFARSARGRSPQRRARARPVAGAGRRAAAVRPVGHLAAMGGPGHRPGRDAGHFLAEERPDEVADFVAT